MEIPKNIDVLKQQFLEQCRKEDIFRKIQKIKKNYAQEWKKLPESIKKTPCVTFYRFHVQLQRD